MSGECPNKKKGGLKRKDKGRHRGKGKKKNSDEEAEESQPSNEEMQIQALLKKLPKDQHLDMLVSMEQDF
ncbi:hypothetical protein AX14_008256 [Amanita brunnescens Koide BX004]|nr:hypothetical protein AX14_008256 [Amanita brunnescens Koide BX004]